MTGKGKIVKKLDTPRSYLIIIEGYVQSNP